MTKQEKIKEAYGECWEKVKNNVTENGWIDTRFFSLKDSGIKYIQSKSHEGLTLVFSHRPLSLQGIENNNGWTKIESENDLPKKSGHYWVKRGNEICTNYIIYPESYSLAFIKHLTHYQPIQKPEPPIY